MLTFNDLLHLGAGDQSHRLGSGVGAVGAVESLGLALVLLGILDVPDPGVLLAAGSGDRGVGDALGNAEGSSGLVVSDGDSASFELSALGTAVDRGTLVGVVNADADIALHLVGDALVSRLGEGLQGLLAH